MLCPQEQKDQGKCNKDRLAVGSLYHKKCNYYSEQVKIQPHQQFKWTWCHSVTMSYSILWLKDTHHDIMMQVHQMCKNLQILTPRKSEFLVLNIQPAGVYFMRMTTQCWTVPWSARLTQQRSRSDPQSVKHQLWFIKWQWDKFSLSASVTLYHYHVSNVPYSFLHLSTTLHNP